MAIPTTPIDDVATITARLDAARVAHRDAQEVAERSAKLFRKTVVEAIDAGMTQRQVAELAGVSRARLHAILVTEYGRP